MERGGWCWSPAPPSPAGRPRIQRLLEQPERSGPDRSPGLHRSAEPIAGILLVRPPHSQTGHQLSGSSPWSAPPGAQGRREPGTCVCCREVSPGAPGAFSLAGWGCKLQTSATRVGRGGGSLGALVSWRQVGEAAGGRRAGPWASALSRAISAGAPLVLLRSCHPPAPGSGSTGLRSARLGCNRGGDSEPGPGGGRRTDDGKARRERDRGAETGRRWRLSRGRAGKPGRGRVREARRVGTRGRLRV